MPEFEFVNVERKILFAYLLECVHDPALHDGPEEFDGVRVNVPRHVLAATVMHHAMREMVVNVPIASIVVGRD